MSEINRFDRLRGYMVTHRIRWKNVADILGMSATSCLTACQRERIRVEHHDKLVKYGFPADILPEPNYPKNLKPSISQIPQMVNQ